jgi:hypothetical protein
LLQTGYQDDVMVIFVFVPSNIVHQSPHKLSFTNLVPTVWMSVARWNGASVPVMP